MKSNELRIGNYLQDTNHPERFCMVFRLSSGNDYSITYTYNKAYEESYKKSEQEKFIQPIPLTEDWLLKLGFEKNEYNFWDKHIINDWTKILIHPAHGLCEISLSGHGSIIWHIKHVHQLQNLYFALTGEELTIKN